MKTIVMPNRDDMLRRLVGVMDEPHAQEGFYSIVLRSAGNELNGYGVVTMLTLALHDYSALPMVKNIIQRMMPRFVEALVDDEEVRKDALHLIEEAESKIKKDREEVEAVLPPVEHRKELSWEEATKLYAAARKIANLVWEHIPENDLLPGRPAREDWRWQGANPYYNQTIDGLFLEYYYGNPVKVWTPWGEWQFVGSGAHMPDSIVEEIMSHFSTTVHVEERYDRNIGVLGPVFAVHAIDEEALPEPAPITDRRQYLEYKDAKEFWDRLTRDWCETNGIEPPAEPDDD